MKIWHMVDLAYALISGEHDRLISGNNHFYVAQVEVVGQAPQGSGYHLHNLRDQTARLAERVPHIGKPVIVKLVANKVYFRGVVSTSKKKKPDYGKVGLQVTAAVFDGPSELGRTAILLEEAPPIKSSKARALASGAIDAEQNNMDYLAAEDLLERIYGTEDWDKWMHP
ncbi:hypothetical protein [Aestuariivirga litoralis]|uniref:hypothetical protein n=1 Tax=Aestuariivirga litoralis TaxID=2650924 RepID=UPI0018C4E813|nr:hypothetical protein [Aestuariivirga litoralis]MBG1232878.1 hypothetical protein [Aestuariivirga litoralis]